MSSVGVTLKKERESQGRSMAEIADTLCITQQYLKAIEKDDIKDLPGTFFYKSFVKQYADALGMDQSQFHAGLAALIATHETQVEFVNAPKVAAETLIADTNKRNFSNARLGLSTAGLVAVMVVCSVVYAWWTKPAAHKVAAAPVAQAVTIPTANVPDPPAPVSAPSTQATPAVPAEVANTVVNNEGMKHVVLNLSAKERTWLSISSEGKNIFSGILQPSETKTLTSADAATMTVGNAGGIEVELNGKPVGPIGKSGQVVRVRFKSPDDFEILQPNSQAQPTEAL